MMDFSTEIQNRPLCTLSAFSYVPPRRTEPRQMSYFNRESKAPDVSTYSQIFHQMEGFDMKLPRDDRRHWRGQGLDINQEEKSRRVPLRSSSEYGRHPVHPLLQTERSHARVDVLKAEIYTKNGITWTVSEGYGSVVPT